jgi:hypothetical protein
MSMSKTWKNVERAIAEKLGGQRMSNHALGLRTPDVESPWLSVEVKHRKALPLWIKEAMTQAETNGDEAKLPLVVLHEKGRRHDNDLVVLRLGDFVDWFGEFGAEDEREDLA